MGMALVRREEGVNTLLFSATLHPWEAHALLDIVERISMMAPIERVVIEVPQNGTHDSRGGVHFAAGMAVGALVSKFERIKRRMLLKVKPSEWRRAIFG